MQPGSPSAGGRDPAPLGRDLLVTAGLACGPMAALGLGRFAYALLLPSMRDDLSWSFTEAGALTTANAAGYLLGAVVATPIARRYGTRSAFLWSFVVVALSLAGCAATAALAPLVVLRAVAGIAGAVTFVAGASLTARAAADRTPGRAALLLGVYVAGGGLGILVSGLGVPVLLDTLDGSSGWRMGWVVLGAVALLSVPAASTASRGLRAAPPPVAGLDRSWGGRALAASTGAYVAFGVGYIAYMTFVVAHLRAQGLGTAAVTGFWCVLGAATVASAFCWSPVLGRARGGQGLALMLAITAVGAALPLAPPSPLVVYGSAVLFGAAFLAVVTAVTLVAQQSLPAHQWPAAIGGLTVAGAIGQLAGPVLAGVISDRTGGVATGLAASAVVLALGSLLALAQRDRPPAAAPVPETL